jgi:C4-dicarboxylate-specific signal transduction histidine kinase
MPSRYPEAAFLSTVTGGVTHEMRNVLAIIKESAGLLGDMVSLHAEGRALDPDRLRRAVDRVDAQVKRGASILAALNRISHAIDEDIATLDLDEELRQVVFLSRRKARICGLVLQNAEPTGKSHVRASPLRLQMALFSTLDRCIETLPEGTTIVSRVHAEMENVSVEFRGEPDPGSQPIPGANHDRWQEIQAWVSAVGGDLRILDQGSGVEIRFGLA